MHDKPVSLIAMDMDGTLLDSRQRLTPGNLAALRKAQAAGIHLAICSGRLPGDVAMFLDEAGLPDCAILSLNGAYCLKRCMEGEFFNHPLENATLEAAVAILRRARFPFGCFAQNRLAIFKGDFRWMTIFGARIPAAASLLNISMAWRGLTPCARRG